MGQGTGPEAEDLLPVRAEGGTGLGTGPWQLCGGGAVEASVRWGRGSPSCLWVGGQEENTTGRLLGTLMVWFKVPGKLAAQVSPTETQKCCAV